MIWNRDKGEHLDTDGDTRTHADDPDEPHGVRRS